MCCCASIVRSLTFQIACRIYFLPKLAYQQHQDDIDYASSSRGNFSYAAVQRSFHEASARFARMISNISSLSHHAADSSPGEDTTNNAVMGRSTETTQDRDDGHASDEGQPKPNESGWGAIAEEDHEINQS